MHAACVELHDPVGIRKAAEPYTRIFGIQFDYIDACYQGVEYVRATCETAKRFFNAGNVAPILETVAIARGNDDRSR
jgi:hypothetical protein